MMGLLDPGQGINFLVPGQFNNTSNMTLAGSRKARGSDDFLGLCVYLSSTNGVIKVHVSLNC